MNAQKEKTSGVHASSRKLTKKCAMKMKETNNKKQHACKNHAKQKHLGCKKGWGQSEATLQTGRRDQKV